MLKTEFPRSLKFEREKQKFSLVNNIKTDVAMGVSNPDMEIEFTSLDRCLVCLLVRKWKDPKGYPFNTNLTFLGQSARFSEDDMFLAGYLCVLTGVDRP